MRRRGNWLRVVVYALVIGLYVPLFVVMLYSLNGGANLSWPMRGLSFRWFSTIFSDPVFSQALRTSAEASASVACLSVAIATCAALVFTRRPSRLTTALQSLSLLPAMIPPLFIAIALFTSMAALGIQPGMLTIILGQLIVTIPFTLVVITVRLQRFEVELEAAARDLGAGPLTTLRRITFRIMLPSIVGAALLAFAFSFDEVLITNFTSGSDVTVPLYVYSKLHRSVDPSVNAVATLLLLVPWLALAVAGVLLRLGGGLGAMRVGRRTA